MAHLQQTLSATPSWAAQIFLSSCLTLRLNLAGSRLQLIFTAMMSTCNEVHMLDRPFLISSVCKVNFAVGYQCCLDKDCHAAR